MRICMLRKLSGRTAFVMSVYLFSAGLATCWPQGFDPRNPALSAWEADAVAETGVAHFNAGRYPEAARSFERALPLHVAKYGASHEQTVALAGALRKTLDIMEALAAQKINVLRQVDEGMRWQREVFEVRRRWLGEYHRETLDALDQLASYEYGRGNIEQAV